MTGPHVIGLPISRRTTFTPLYDRFGGLAALSEFRGTLSGRLSDPFEAGLSERLFVERVETMELLGDCPCSCRNFYVM